MLSLRQRFGPLLNTRFFSLLKNAPGRRGQSVDPPGDASVFVLAQLHWSKIADFTIFDNRASRK
jgi:hypothetical protein